MDQPLSPPLKLLAERGNVASPVMMLMLKLANPLYTHTGLALALMHTQLPGNQPTTQAVGEDGRAQEQRNETESEHMHMAGFPGAWNMLEECEM